MFSAIDVSSALIGGADGWGDGGRFIEALHARAPIGGPLTARLYVPGAQALPSLGLISLDSFMDH